MGTVWRSETSTAGPIERILLLAPLPIGDTLFVSPTIHALRETFPGVHMTALVHETTAELMNCIPGVDAVEVLPVGADWEGGGQLIRSMMQLRRERYNAAVDFSSPAYKWIVFMCGVPIRTYMKFDPCWWLLPDEHDQWRTMHATEHYYNCAIDLGLPPWHEVDHRPHLRLPDACRESARAFAYSRWRDRTGPLVAIHAGGMMLDGVKRWPAERFAAVADALREDWGARVMLLGGPEDVELAQSVAEGMRLPGVVAAGDVPLLTSLALLEMADLFVGNDSGLLHAAAALGTRYVGIYGPTSLENFRPIPLHPNQGRIALPPLRCPEPRYFVGGDVVWRQPRCREICSALATLPVSTVLSHAVALLQTHVSSAGAV